MGTPSLSFQDMQDLQRIKSLLPANDPRSLKIDALVKSSVPQGGYGSQSAEEAKTQTLKSKGLDGGFWQSAGSAVAGAGKGLYHLLADPATQEEKDFGYGDAMSYPLRVLGRIAAPNIEMGRRAVEDAKAGNVSLASGHGLAALLPMVGPWAANVGEQVGQQTGAGNWSGAAGTLAGNALLYEAPKLIGRGAGSLADKAAPAMAETAMGIRNADRGLGRTPGQAIIAETEGIHPGDVAASAKGRIADHNANLESSAAASKDLASLAPARQVASSAKDVAIKRNNPATIKQVGQIGDQLTYPNPPGPNADIPASSSTTISPLVDGFGRPILSETVTPARAAVKIPDLVPPRQLLDLKRGIGDLKGSWNPATPNDLADATIGNVYHALDSELDRTVPGAKDLNQRMSSLIPVAARAGAKDLNAGLLQRVLGRFGAPTGALAGGIGGAIAGHSVGGPLGGLVGGVAGTILPEFISSPSTQMFAARSMASPGLRSFLRPILPASVAAGKSADRER